MNIKIIKLFHELANETDLIFLSNIEHISYCPIEETLQINAKSNRNFEIHLDPESFENLISFFCYSKDEIFTIVYGPVRD